MESSVAALVRVVLKNDKAQEYAQNSPIELFKILPSHRCLLRSDKAIG